MDKLKNVNFGCGDQTGNGNKNVISLSDYLKKKGKK